MFCFLKKNGANFAFFVSAIFSVSVPVDLAYTSEFEKFGVSFRLENKKTEEVFYSTVELFGYLNNREIVWNGIAKNTLLAIVESDIIVDEKIIPQKISYLGNSDKHYLLEQRFVGEGCFLKGVEYPWREASSERAKSATTEIAKRTIVVMDSRGWSVDQQLACLGAGFLLSQGVSGSGLDVLRKQTSRELFRGIVSGDLLGETEQ